jgi:putative FmdB family regulatory protein
MPMYEFFCPECNKIYTFYSRTINTATTPPCPQCKGTGLRRMISPFAVGSRSRGDGGADEAGADGDLPIDASRMERAMEALASEADAIDDDNPQQAAGLMRKFSSLAGLRLGDRMEDAISRMEAGDDPEALEREMGELDETELFRPEGGSAAGNAIRRRIAPGRDETLYEM